MVRRSYFRSAMPGFLALVVLWVTGDVLAANSGAAWPVLHLSPQARVLRAQALAHKLGIDSAATPDAPTIAARQVLDMAPADTALGPWVSVGPTVVLGAQGIGPNGFCDKITVDASGRATALAFGASGSRYLGTAGGGVWRSLDQGSTWKPLTDRQPSLAVGAIAVVAGATQTQDVIYVGTGESNGSGSQYGQGILKSTDGGSNWTSPQLGLDPFALQTFGRIAVVAGAATDGADIVYAATTSGVIPGSTSSGATAVTLKPPGVYKSTDGGSTWMTLSTGKTDKLPKGDTLNGAADLALDPKDPQTLYAAIKCSTTCTDGGLWKSTDAGDAWTHLTAGLPNVSNRMALYIPNSSRLYAANAIGTNFDAVYVSSDSGATWTRGGTLPQVKGGSECLAIGGADSTFTLGGNPKTPDTVFLGLVGLYRSDDGGKSWRYTVDKSHADFHDIKVDKEDRIYALNDGGFSVSTNGSNWKQTINLGLETLQFEGNGLGPQNGSIIIGGTQDNGSELYQGDPKWKAVAAADGGWASISPAGGVYFAQFQEGALIRSNSGTAPMDFLPISPQLDQSTGEMPPFYTAVVQDPSNADRLLYGTFRVWQSCLPGTVHCNATSGGPTDGSSSTPVNWSPLSPALDPGCGQPEEETGPQPRCLISDIRVAPSDPATMYVVTTSNGKTGPFAWLSRNSNSPSPTFTNISAGLARAGLPKGQDLSSVAISPVNPAIVMVSVTGFNPDGKHIFESTNAGTAWMDITKPGSDYPDIPTLKVLFDANDPTGQTIYAGTSDGVLRTTDSGKTWKNFNLDSLPLVQVFDLQQNPETLLAGTHGRSVWTIKTANPGASVDTSPKNSGGRAGETVAAGTIPLRNLTSTPAGLRSVTIAVEKPQLISSMTLNAGSETVTNSTVSTGTTFNFQKPVSIPAGSALSLNLNVVMANPGQSAMVSRSGRLTTTLNGPGVLNEESLAKSLHPNLTLAALAIGLALTTAGVIRRRYLTIAAALILLMVAAAQSGCGGSSEGAPVIMAAGSSSLTVTQVWVSQWPGSLEVTGLPASIGNVTLLE